jgi:integrase
MKLTDAVIKAKTKGLQALAKETGKPQKLPDGAGLYLLFTPAGSRSWNGKYRIAGKEKRATYGLYPETTLAQARKRHQDARKLLAEGVDPAEKKKADKRAAKLAAANSFEAAARTWLSEHHRPHVADSTYSRTASWLERDVFPWIGRRPISEIDAPEVLAVLRRVDARGKRHTVHKIRGSISMIFRFAVAQGLCGRDPARDLVGAIPPAQEKHFAAITDPKELGALLRVLDGAGGSFITQCCVKLLPMLFVRPGELRAAEWAHIDLDRAEWRYTVSKTNTDHLVPLPAQAVAILRELHQLTGGGRYVFPGVRDHQLPLSSTTINALLKRLGYDTKTEVTGHGFRATARTLLAEQLGQRPEVIEHQLAHAVPDTLGRAYNRTKFIKERQHMMQAWADYLDTLRVGGNVIPLTRTA